MKESKIKKESFNVYFSVPSSFCSKRKLLEKIVKVIEKSGGKLTLRWFEDKTKHSPEELFHQAVEGIKSADILVAEISSPSTGVGQQISYAISWKIPVIAIYRKGRSVPSRFTIGNSSDSLRSLEYDEESLEKLLKEKFKEILKKRFVKFNFISTREINDYLNRESLSRGISKSQLLRSIILDWRESHLRLEK